jgi:hypothetical protein
MHTSLGRLLPIFVLFSSKRKKEKRKLPISMKKEILSDRGGKNEL